jgi:hypothetical protein
LTLGRGSLPSSSTQPREQWGRHMLNDNRKAGE